MEVAARDLGKMGQRRVAVFRPKNVATVRPELLKHIGQRFAWICSDYGGEDEPYPGQYRWFPITEDGTKYGGLIKDFAHWAPDEDLEDVAAETRSQP